MNSSFRIIDPFLSCPPAVEPKNLPQEMQSLTNEISQTTDQEASVRYAYDALSKKYHGSRFLTFLRLNRFFITNFSALWAINGFLHCNHLNYLLRTLLIASGKFSTEDIYSHWTQIWYFSPHQYLSMKLADGTILSVDLWGKVYGIPFGSYAHGFQAGTIETSTSL